MWVPNWKQRKDKESERVPWLVALWRGRRACWSSGRGLGRCDKLIHSLATYTKPTTRWLVHLGEHPWCWDKPRATPTHLTHHGPDSGEATTFPLIVYSAPLHAAMGALCCLSVYQSRPWSPCPNAPFFNRILSAFSLRWWKFAQMLLIHRSPS
jgi:hypothetical protein